MRMSGFLRRDHRRLGDLLPWYVNGTLEGNELADVEAHLEDCASCRSELAREQQLAAGVRRSEEMSFSYERAFERLTRRLDAEPVGESRRLPREANGWGVARARRALGGLAPATRLALVAQAAAIVVLLLMVARADEPRGEFRTLSAPTTLGSVSLSLLRVVFVEDAQESEIRALLQEIDGLFVDGPTSFGVYTIAIKDEQNAPAIGVLRDSDLVAFAEPARDP